jgi:hypothetical protein
VHAKGCFVSKFYKREHVGPHKISAKQNVKLISKQPFLHQIKKVVAAAKIKLVF